MKAIVLSDSHRDFRSIMRALEKENDIGLIIHAGDVHSDVEDIMALKPQTPCAYVIGNNDFFVTNEPKDREFTFGGKKFFLTHGHLYGVKGSLAGLKRKAHETDADICIFGHTHIKHLSEEDGVWYLNPGSTWKSYAVIEISGDDINIQIKDN